MQDLCARLVRPLDIVDHENGWPAAPGGLQKLRNGMRQPRLAHLGKVVRQLWQPRNALCDLRNQGSEFRERHERHGLQRGRRHAIESAGDQIDDRLIRHAAFDLVAIGRDRREVPRLRKARNFAHQSALADAGLPFNQDRVPRPGGKARYEVGQQDKFIPSAHKWRDIASGRQCTRCVAGGGSVGRRVSIKRRGIDAQAAPAAHRASCVEKIAPLVVRDGKRFGEPFGKSPRRTAFVGLDLADRKARTTHSFCERFLGKVQRPSAAPQPIAERLGSIRQHPPPYSSPG